MSSVVNSVITVFRYNAQNKLARIEGQGFSYDFLYDSRNRRVGVCRNNEDWRCDIHDGAVCIATVSNGIINRFFVRGVGIAEGTGDMLAEIDTSGEAPVPHYYVPNHRGDTVVTLTDAGTVDGYRHYEAFGAVLTNIGTFTPLYTFSTKEYLSDAKLYIYAYRVYDPIAARWTQRDPIDYQDSVNLYCFCANNSLNMLDLHGLARVKITYRETDKQGRTRTSSKKFSNPSGPELQSFLGSLDDRSVTEFEVLGEAGCSDIVYNERTGDSLFVDDSGKLQGSDCSGFGDLLGQKLSKDARIHLRGCSTAAGVDNIAKDVSLQYPNAVVIGQYRDCWGVKRYRKDEQGIWWKDTFMGITPFHRTYVNGVVQK